IAHRRDVPVLTRPDRRAAKRRAHGPAVFRRAGHNQQPGLDRPHPSYAAAISIPPTTGNASYRPHRTLLLNVALAERLWGTRPAPFATAALVAILCNVMAYL